MRRFSYIALKRATYTGILSVSFLAAATAVSYVRYRENRSHGKVSFSGKDIVNYELRDRNGIKAAHIFNGFEEIEIISPPQERYREMDPGQSASIKVIGSEIWEYNSDGLPVEVKGHFHVEGPTHLIVEDLDGNEEVFPVRETGHSFVRR